MTDALTMEARYALAIASLRLFGQEHLLRFWDSLSTQQRGQLLAQIEKLQLQLVRETFANRSEHRHHGTPQEALIVRADSQMRTEARLAGEAMLRAGEVCCFTVAGGQGTRLGFDGPKGLYPATPVTKRCLFAVFAEAIAATQSRYGCRVPWYVMTSPLNHEATVAAFKRENWFGLLPEDVRLITQGTMPSLDDEGKILLASRGEVALNPDGHGGSLRAIALSGALRDMQMRGIKTISYFQVDNPLARVCDPLFLGLHQGHPQSSGEMSSKAVPKVSADEKVGVFAVVDGRTTVLEYSDLSRELSESRGGDGKLRFGAGNLAVHAISVEFAARLSGDGSKFALPFHRAHKRVPFMDPVSGEMVEPTAPNAWKLESFVFDAIGFARSAIVVEVDRAEEFAPIKNAHGADSPASSNAAQTERAARWLEAAGVKVPRRADGTPDCNLEISSSTALDAEALHRVPLPPSIARGATLAL